MNIIRVHRIRGIVDTVDAGCRDSIVTCRHDFDTTRIAPDILLSSNWLQGFNRICPNLRSDASGLMQSLNSPRFFSANVEMRKKIEDDRNRKSGQRAEKSTNDGCEPVKCVPAGKQLKWTHKRTFERTSVAACFANNDLSRVTTSTSIQSCLFHPLQWS